MAEAPLLRHYARMPNLLANGVTLHYEDSGGDGTPIVFSHGLLFSGAMFEAQARALSPQFRCIRYDHRGQGLSENPGDRSHTIEECYTDAVAFIDALGVAPCHFVGLSMGGFVGMRLAARRPELLRSLVVIDSSADAEPKENIGRYRLLTAVARWVGIAPIVSQVMPILFSRTFLGDPSRQVERARWRRFLGANRRTIVRAVLGVIEREGVANELATITLPTLVIVGEEDVATTPEKAERIRDLICDARLVRVAGAGHSSTIEQPEIVSAVIADFLATVRS